MSNVPDVSLPIWNELRLLSIVVECGSFAKAGEFTGNNHTTVARKIQRLEDVLKVKILNRNSSGVALTDIGREIIKEVEAIDLGVRMIEKIAKESPPYIKRNIKIAVPDGVAHYLLIPELKSLKVTAPQIAVSFLAIHKPVDLRKGQADLTLGFRTYDTAEFVNVELGTFTMKPFASSHYLKEYGVPKSLDDLRGHTLIEHMAYGIDEGDWDMWRSATDLAPSYAANLSSVHYEMVAAGLGVGLLPTYAELDSKTEPIEMDLEVRYKFYLSYLKSDKANRDLQAAVTWLKWVFQDKLKDWFT